MKCYRLMLKNAVKCVRMYITACLHGLYHIILLNRVSLRAEVNKCKRSDFTEMKEKEK